MADRRRVDLYCEDSGHEQFALALLKRLAQEERVPVAIRTVSGRGGHGQAQSEFKAWQRAAASGRGERQEIPEILVLLIDGNCEGWAQVHQQLESVIDPVIFPRAVIGCPDPHVERWCLADPQAVHACLGVPAPPDPGKCERRLYKRLLRSTIEAAGQPILTNEMEYAPELVAAMDLYRAGKNQSSLRHFVEEVRKAFQSLR